MSSTSRTVSVPSLAIVICTMNRPDLLRRCLTSIAVGEVAPFEVLVSDDSADGRAAAAVCGHFPGVRYLMGPRRGLCANRNAAIRQASADFVSLLDDDAIVSPSFVRRALALAAALPARTLVTGTVIETDRQVIPANRSFLGFFGKPLDNGRLENINLNCNLLPREAFKIASFDEKIRYGYEDMDICAQLMAQGYTIRYEPDLVNTHLSTRRAAIFDKELFIKVEQARFYTSVKRYLLWEPNWLKLLAFVVAAPAHRVLHAVKTRKWFDLPYSVADMIFAIQGALQERKHLCRRNLTRR